MILLVFIFAHRIELTKSLGIGAIWINFTKLKFISDRTMITKEIEHVRNTTLYFVYEATNHVCSLLYDLGEQNLNTEVQMGHLRAND